MSVFICYDDFGGVKMNIGIYLYDGYYETELCVATMLFSKQNLFTIACNQEIVRCMDGKRVMVDKQVKEVIPEDIDVLIIPGGSPILNDDISRLISECEKNGAIIGGICGGVTCLAYAGVLESRRFTSYNKNHLQYDFEAKLGEFTDNMYESDKRIVTAKPDAYLEFALELFRLAGLLDPNDIDDYIEWFRGPSAFKY